jgi:undecaprenyl pyrophosphate phosphatase UppP
MTLECSTLTIRQVAEFLKPLPLAESVDAPVIGLSHSGATTIQSALTATSTTSSDSTAFRLAGDLTPYASLNQTSVTSNATSNLYVLVALVALFVTAAVINGLVRYFRRRTPSR